MKLWMHKIEIAVDKSIPFLLVVLLFIIVGEIFYPERLEPYAAYVNIADNFIIFVFILDLIFKWIRIRNAKKFLKESWMDIIAVFPFFLLFRIFGGTAALFATPEGIVEGQKIFHEGLEIEKEASMIVREAEKAGKIGRSRLFLRFLRPIARVPRFLKAIPFFERPTGGHHWHDREKRRAR